MMKKATRKNLFVFIPILLITVNSSVLFSESLTLTDCINLARANNLDLQQARMDIDQAKAALIEANSSFYPSLNASTNYRFGGAASSDASGSFSSGINAQYTLYKGGSIRAGSQIAKIRVALAEQNYRQKEAEVFLLVKNAFYKILQTEEQISLFNNILKRRKENLTLLKLNYQVGRENEPNVKQAEVNLNQSEYDSLKAEQNLALAKSELNRLLNCEDPDISIQYQDNNISFPGLDDLIIEAKANRPEIVIQNSNQDILVHQKTQTISNYLPTLTVSSSYGLQGEEFLKQNGNWSAGVGLSLPIFNGFSTQSKKKQIDIALKQSALKMQSIINNIETEVRKAYSDWVLANKNLEISTKILEASREAYNLSKLQYEQGQTSYFFLQQKESELTQAENSYINALFNLRSSIASLHKVIGRSN